MNLFKDINGFLFGKKHYTFYFQSLTLTDSLFSLKLFLLQLLGFKDKVNSRELFLDKVKKLQGVTFDWKESDSILNIKQDIGFIAQDVQKVLPELVRENENGKLSLRHQGITPILLEAIKELKAEIEELKKQIK